MAVAVKALRLDEMVLKEAGTPTDSAECAIDHQPAVDTSATPARHSAKRRSDHAWPQCGHCGKQSRDLLICLGCYSAHFCDDACLRAAWYEISFALFTHPIIYRLFFRFFLPLLAALIILHNISFITHALNTLHWSKKNYKGGRAQASLPRDKKTAPTRKRRRRKSGSAGSNR